VLDFVYLPRKRKTAVGRAKMPVRIPQMAPPKLTPNAESPANKKNQR
jgi:hypothetical protein